MLIYITGKYINKIGVHVVWELQGVFNNKESAEAACRDYRYFVGPVKMNEAFSDETIVWPGCYYPIIR